MPAKTAVFWVYFRVLVGSTGLAQARPAAWLNTCMKIYEVVQPKTPEQQRLDSLRAASKRASDAVKQERDRQKLHKAQKTIQQVRSPQPPKP